MSLPEPREQLARMQAALVYSLTGQGPPPEGFDAGRLQAAAEGLARKRLRAVRRAWPALARALGEDFVSSFTAFAGSMGQPRRGGPLADGWAFARSLSAAGKLPEAGQLEMLAVSLHYKQHPDGLVPRRGPALRLALLRGPRRLVVAVRLPWLGERWLSLPLWLWH